jgi:protein-disulfide isomerase
MTNRWRRALTLLWMLPALAAAAPLGAEPMTREQGDALLQELKAIRQLLERQQVQPQRGAGPGPAQPPAPQRVTVDLKDAYAMGKADAPVTMVAFVDYECPFCKRFDTQTLPGLKAKYIDTGRLRYVIRDLPLEFHKRALKASEATYCAAEQGKYWELREKLIVHSDRLDPESLLEHGKAVGVSMEPFRQCLDAAKYAGALTKGLETARALGISGTPTFVIGRTARGDVLNGVKVVGAQPAANFERHIDELLGGGEGK